MTTRLTNSKGTNLSLAVSEPVGENAVASRQRNEVPLAEHEVASGPRRKTRELDPMIRMVEMMKDLQQVIYLLKEGRKDLGD